MSKGEDNSRAELDSSEPPHVKEHDQRKKVTMVEEMFEKYRQTVRLMRRISPAGQQLTFDQALRLAERYAEIYERFLASKATINAFEVRVGAKEILGAIQNRPDGVRELRYRGAIPGDAVIQIWRSADKQFDEVPLLFQDLEGIPNEGVSRTERYPNGQSITLRVIKEQNNEFCVNLALAFWKKISIADSASLIDGKESTKTQSDKPRVKAKAAYQRVCELVTGAGQEMPAAIYAATLSSARGMRAMPLFLIVSVILLIGTLSAQPQVKRDVLTQPREQPRPVQDSNSLGRNSNPASTTSSGEQGIWASGEKDPEAVDRARVSSTPHNGGVLASVTVRTNGDSSTSSSSSTATTAASSDLTATAKVTGKDTSSSPIVITNWDKECDVKLAKLTQVYVEEPNDPALDQASIARIREDFIKALEQQGIKVLDEGIKGQPTNGIGIIRLRFEPNKESKGAVFAELRDLEGQYIWDDKAGCKTLIGADLNTILGDASHRLGTLMIGAIQQAQRNVDGGTVTTD